nr:protein ENDOSPERM DEFECTIVE 1-like [Ipomoea batatas]
MAEAVSEAGDSCSLAAATAPPPPIPQNRRPRVREVSSRFMSPLISSSSSSASSNSSAATPTHADHQRPKSAYRRHPHQQSLYEPLSSRPAEDENIPDIMRNSTGSQILSKAAILSTVQRKQQKAKVLKENGGARLEQQQVVDVPQSKRVSSRPDTPNVTGADRIVPSRYRQTPQTLHRPSPNHGAGGGGALVSAAAKLLQEATSAPGSPRSVSNDSDTDDKVIGPRKLSKVSTAKDDADSSDNESIHGKSYPNSPVCVSSKMRTQSGMRSSLPEVDRWLVERNCNSVAKSSGDCDSHKLTIPTCARSLNLTRSSSDLPYTSSPWISLKASDMPGTAPCRSSVKNLCLPPQPTSTKLGLDAKKGRKIPNQQEDVHSLKLLHNHYLQWRYANAKAEVSMQSQTLESERKLYSLGCKIKDLRDTVSRKRNELEILQRIKTISTILETQLPYLEEWSSIENEYSTSLSEAASALQNSSLRLPVSGVRVDVKELAESFNSATKVMETVAFHIQSFVPKAEEIDSLISGLARVSGGERSLIEECGDLLLKVHASQIIECSLKGHMVQLHRTNYKPLGMM